MYRGFVKRLLDIVFSAVMLIAGSPVLIILSLLVRTRLGSPVLFKQERPGRNGKIFYMYKFRSMTNERDKNGELKPDEERLTPFGRKLRSTSLDELPELINVLKGDMSFIGPRPLLVRYLPLYNSRQARRHLTRPGITGYAQAFGRNSITWEEKFEKDVWYVEHITFLTDVKIIFQTIKTVFKREGIDAAGGGTMAAFEGSSKETFYKMGGSPRVLFLCNDSAGLWLFRREILRAFADKGFEVHAAFPDDRNERVIKEAGVTVHRIEMSRRGVNPVKDIGYMRRVRALLKEIKPDIVLTYTIKPNAYGGYLCGRLGIPYFSTVTGLGTAFERGGAVKFAAETMYRAGLKCSDTVFFQNEENRRIFEERGLINKKRTVLLPGSGVDLDEFKAKTYPGHGDDVTRFFYIGRIMREKGVGEFIEAAARLHERFGDKVSFAVMGYTEGDMEEEIKRAEEKGLVRIIGFKEDVTPYLREADAVVLPSYHEGMSNVLLEAAACARPCIASDIPGCREAVEEGVSGFLFRPRDAAALISAMERFMRLSEEERREMGLAGRAKMEREFDRRYIINEVMTRAEKIIYGSKGR